MTFIKGIASLGAAMLIGLSALPVQAGYVVDLTQVGSDVVASGNGAIDLTGLSFVGSRAEAAGLLPSINFEDTGPVNTGVVHVYSGITGPSNFGSGGFTAASSGSGDRVGIDNEGTVLFVPLDYVSDSPLLDTSTYAGKTFSSLGVTPGTYEWTWGSGANQNFTLVIGTVVPEPSTWAMMLIGFAGLGFMGMRRSGRRRTAGNA
jgi:PEP-CTERM motif